MDKDAHHKHETHHAIDEEVERKPVDSKKSLLFILIVIGVIILIVGATIILSKYVFVNPNTVTYNHYEFDKFEGNLWMTQQLIKDQLYNIPFYNNPTQVLDIAVDPQSIDAIRQFSTNPNGTVYISVDPYANSRIVLAGIEFARILGKGYNIYNMDVKSAISTPVNYTANVQVITCQNQSSDVFVIYPTITDKNLISLNGNCIIMESKNATESIRVADAFAFRLLNIIPNN